MRRSKSFVLTITKKAEVSFTVFLESGSVLVDRRHDNLGGTIALGFLSSSSLSNKLILKGVGQGTIFEKLFGLTPLFLFYSLFICDNIV